MNRAMPSPPVERYVCAAELAATMGVSLSTVKRWNRAGMPSETWGHEADTPLPAWRRDLRRDSRAEKSRSDKALGAEPNSCGAASKGPANASDS